MMLSTTENLYEEEVWSKLSDYITSPNERMMFFCGRPLKSTQDDESHSNVIFNLMKLMPLRGIISLTGSLNYYVGSQVFKEFLDGLNNVPIVSISVPMEGCALVHCDNYRSSYDLCLHLVNHGYKAFGIIKGPMSSPESVERFKGIEDALLESKIKSYHSIEGDFSERSGYEACKELMKESLDAIICCNDLMAIGAIRAFKEKEVKIPEEIALVGFDDIEQVRLLEIPLTTIKQPFSDMACKAFDLLKSNLIQDACIPSKQIIRESCGCPKEFSSIEGEEKDKRYYMTKYAQSLNEYTVTIRLRSSFDQIKNLKELYKVVDQYMHIIGGQELHLCLFQAEKHVIENPLDFKWPQHMHYGHGYINGNSYGSQNFLTMKGLPDDIIQTSACQAYLFYPIHQNAFLYGYMVVDAKTAKNRLFTSLKREITNTLNRIDMMSQIHQYSKKMQALSETDILTGIMNRRGLDQYVSKQFEKDIEMGLCPGLIFCDVNGLKKINDNYGHDVGDQLIVDTADLLSRVFRDYTLARMGGDEFVVYISNCCRSLLKRINDDLSNQIKLFNQESNRVYILSLEAGMVSYDSNIHSCFQSLMKEADQNLYIKKKERNYLG